MWALFGKLLLGIALSYIAYLLSPRPPAPEAATLEDFSIPQTTEGTEVGVVYGTTWINGAHVTWFGDFRSQAIKSKSGKK